MALTICIGIEYRLDRCELWTRPAGTGNGAVVCVPSGAMGEGPGPDIIIALHKISPCIWTVTSSLLPTMAIQKVCMVGTNLALLLVPLKSGTTMLFGSGGNDFSHWL